jgi:putative ABC transport system permease protein
VLAGRGFTAADRQGSQRVVVISRRMADMFWPGEDPVGRPILLGQPAIVVGVVGNVRSQTLAMEAMPEMYVPHAQTTLRSIMYVVKSMGGSRSDPTSSPTAATSQVLSAARQVVQKLDPRLPLIFSGSMSDLVDRQLARPRFYVVLLGLFAALALILAAVGIYGVVAYLVTQRTREIGVRMVLGANQREVVGLMLWQGLRPAVAGMALGLVVAMLTGRLIQGLLYQVQPHDPLTVASVSLTLLAVVLIACVIPALRASAVAPADALRSE